MNPKLALPILLGLLAFPGSALGAGPAGPVGSTIACIHDGLAITSPACDPANALTGASSVVASADGTLVFVGAPGAAAVSFFARDAATGTLTPGGTRSGCIANAGANGCEDGHDLAGAASLALTPDGKVLYVAATTDSAVSGWAVGSDGALTAIPGACYHTAITETGCIQDVDLGGASSVVVSADGRSLYVASTTPGTVATYAIGMGGVLTRAGTAESAPGVGALAIAGDGLSLYATTGTTVLSWSRSATDGALTLPSTLSLTGAAGLAVAADGDVVVTTGYGVTVLRPSGGALAPVAGGCVHDGSATAGCSSGHHLAGANAVRVSGDGATAYVTAGTANAVSALALASSGALTQPASPGSCSHDGATTASCAGTHDLDGANALAILTGGDVLVTASSAVSLGSVVSFRPQHAPACISGSATVERGSSQEITLACTDADGDGLLYGFNAGPDHGTAGQVNNATGRLAYTPLAAFTGTDVIAFYANDGSNTATAATFTIRVRDTITPRLELTFGSLTARNGVVHLTVKCKGNDPCNGTVVIRTVKGVVIGHRTFKAATSGSLRTFTVTLTASGTAQLLKRRKLAVVAVASVTDGARHTGTSTARATIRS